MNKNILFVSLLIAVIFCALPIWSDGQGGNMSILERLLRLEKLIPPLGTIMAWHKSMPGNKPLPDGWVECNGQALSDPQSPFHGQVIPNLNGSKGYFLRGGTTSGTMQNECVNPAGLTVDIAHDHAASSVSGTVGGKDGTHAHEIGFDTNTSYRIGFSGGFVGPSAILSGGGNRTSTVIATPENSAHSHGFSLTAGGQSLGATSKNVAGGGDETRPINMSVVWIMRVK